MAEETSTTDSMKARAKAAFDAAKASWNSHEEAIIGGMKGLMGLDAKSRENRDFVDGGKPVSKAVDDAVNSAPGNNADY